MTVDYCRNEENKRLREAVEAARERKRQREFERRYKEAKEQGKVPDVWPDDVVVGGADLSLQWRPE